MIAFINAIVRLNSLAESNMVFPTDIPFDESPFDTTQ